MRTIHKYILKLADVQTVPTYKWCQPLYTEIINGDMCLWAIVDTDEPKVDMTVTIFGTGEPIPKNYLVSSDGALFVGTVFRAPHVWHVFVTGSFTRG